MKFSLRLLALSVAFASTAPAQTTIHYANGTFNTPRNTTGNPLTLSTGAGITATEQGAISGTGGMTKTGAGTLTLSVANTYTGGTTLAEGTLLLDADQRLAATGALTINGGVLDQGGFAQTAASLEGSGGRLANGPLTLNQSTATTFHGHLYLASLVFNGSGAGELTLAGADDNFFGIVTVNGGIVNLAKANAIAHAVGNNGLALTINDGGTVRLGGADGDQIYDNSQVILNTGGTFDLRGHSEIIRTLTGAGTVTNTSAGTTSTLTLGHNNGTDTFAGTLQDGNTPGGALLALTKTGTGTLTLSGTNTFTGGTTVSAGTLQLGNSGTILSDTGRVTVNGGTFALGTANETIGSLAGTGGVVELFNGSGRTLTVGGDDTSTAYTGIIQGSGALAKTGSGTLTLGGASTFTGGITLSQGVLSVGADSHLGGASNPVAFTGGTLRITGTSLASFGSHGLNTGSFTGGLDIADASHTFTLNQGLGGTGSLTKSGAGTLTLGSANTFTGGIQIDAGRLIVANSLHRRVGIGIQGADGVTLQVRGAPDGGSGSVIGAEGNVGLSNTAGSQPVVLGNSSSVINSGIITGGNGGFGSHVTTYDLTVTGGFGANGAGALKLGQSAHLANTGTITGGNGGSGGNARSEYTAATPHATATAGPGAPGGIAAELGQNATVTNGNTLRGGQGGEGGDASIYYFNRGTAYAGHGGAGGAALVVGSASTVTNTLTITGGNGGMSGAVAESRGTSIVKFGGAGGSGVTLGSGSTLTNSGTITGGNGGSREITNGGSVNGAGGAAITGSDLTVINSGTLTAGFNGDGTTRGNAIVFTGTTNRLDLRAGSLITGNVLAGGTSDTLTFAHGGGLTLDFSQLGDTQQYRGFEFLAITGTGTLTVANATTYSGTTTFSGTLQIGNGGTSGSFAGHIASDTQVIFDRSDNSTYGGNLSGTGSVTKQGTGTLTLTGANSHSGGTTVSQGTLVGNATSLQGAFTNNATLTFDQGTAGTFAGAISGSGSVTKTGIGDLTLTGANTYSGPTTIAQGTLQLGASHRLGDGSAVSIASGATFALDGFNETVASLSGAGNISLGSGALTVNPNSIANLTFSGVISGSGSLTYTGTDIRYLTGTNTYTGGTTIATGFLYLGNSGTVLADTGRVTVSSGSTLLLGTAGETIGSLAGTGSVSLNNSKLTVGGDNTSSTYSGSMTTAGGALEKIGAGTLTLTATNSYSGGTTLSAGTLIIGRPYDPSDPLYAYTTPRNVLSDSGAVIVNGGTLVIVANETVASLSGTGGVIQLGSAVVGGSRLTVGGDNSSTSYSGVIDGVGNWPYYYNGELLKTGTGTLTLSGTTALGNGLSISAGTLQLGASNILSDSLYITVASGATFALNGFNDTVKGFGGGGNISLGSGALTIDSSETTAISGAISGTGSLTKSGTGTLTLSGPNSYTGGTTVSDGTLRLDNSGTILVETGRVSVNGGTFALGAAHATIGSLAGTGGTVELFNGSGRTLTVGGDNTSSTYAGTIQGSGGALTKTGTGTLTLSGANTFTGATTLSAGTLALGSTGALGTTGTISFGGGSLQFSAANTTDYSSRFSTAAGQSYALDTNGQSVTLANALTSSGGSLTKTGSGTLTLSGANTYSGTTTIAQGTLQLGASHRLGDSSAVSVASDATFALDGFNETIASLSGAGSISLGSGALTVGANNESTTYAGAIQGAGGSLVKTGTGRLILSGENTHTGGTTVANGILEVRGSITGNIVNDTALIFNPAADQIFAGTISGTGSVMQSGSGTLTLSSASTYTGGTTLSGGTLAIGHNTALSTGALSLNGGALAASEGARTLANNYSLDADSSFSGSHALTLTGAGTLTGFKSLTVASGTTVTLAGAIGQSRSSILIKEGAGTLELTGANTFSGGALLAGGTTIINNSTGSAFGTGAVTVEAGATLAGAGSFTGALQLNGLYSPGNSPGEQETGSQIWAANAGYIFEINNTLGAAGTVHDLVTITGSLTLAATSANPFIIELTSLTLGNVAGATANFNDAADYAFTFVTTTTGISGFAANKFFVDTTAFTNPFTGDWSVAQNGNTLALTYTAAGTAIPEPSTYAMIFGALALACAAWRKRQ